MGRQSARIYYQGLDHKEMVTWDGTKYQYHDKAYIWDSKTHSFQLVWEKYQGLKLLYASELELRPVSSENNKYLYFTEGTDGHNIYRIVINSKNPQKETHYHSEKYDTFSAPRSSRGFAVYAEKNQTGVVYDYQILNLEEGTIYTSGRYNAAEYLWGIFAYQGPPDYTNQEVSPAESGMNHNYASMFGTYLATQAYQPWNFILFVAPTGISAMQLDNREGAGNWINGRGIWDLGRLNDGTARGLLPRFLFLTYEGQFKILEYGVTIGTNLYSATVTSDPPFDATPSYSLETGVQLGIVRDDTLHVLDKTGKIWLIKANLDSISYENTDVESYIEYDVSPDFKYAITSKYADYYTNQLNLVRISDKKILIDITAECGMSTVRAKFIGHKCIFVQGYKYGTYQVLYKLFKWR